MPICETSILEPDLDTVLSELNSIQSVRVFGSVVEMRGSSLKVKLMGAAVGDLVRIYLRSRTNCADALLAQVTSCEQALCSLAPFGRITGVILGAQVELIGGPPRLHIGPDMLGSVVDCFGNVLRSFAVANSNETPFRTISAYMHNEAPAPLSRSVIKDIFFTGVRSIDGPLTLGQGSRIAVLAEPGVGKSTLLSMITRFSTGNINVVGLIGERGREVADFVTNTLDPETAKRTIIVVSTSDEPAVARILAAQTATRIAEYFRDHGLSVLLMIDSITRLARALRETGLEAGEIPVRRGYPPSVFGELPRLLERAGPASTGSITALYTALLSADIEDDPIVEELKGITDGHIVLSKSLADKGHYPAIDVLRSISRLHTSVSTTSDIASAQKMRSALAIISEEKETLLLGGTPSEDLQNALKLEPQINQFLRQQTHTPSTKTETAQMLEALGKYE